MKSLYRLSGAIAMALTVAQPALADAVINLNVSQQNPKAQSGEPVRLLVHEGKVLLGMPAAAEGKDLRFDRAQNLFHVIDHRRRNVMAVDEAAVIQLTDQAQAMLMMARGFSEQLSLLPPKQRAKLEKMIGGEGALAQLNKPNNGKMTGKQSFHANGGKVVGGISCQRLEVLGNGGKLAELCLAKAGSTPLAEQDYATLEAMRQQAQRLAQRAAPLAQQFGFPLPPLDDAKLSGLPVEMRNLSGNNRETVTLTQISSEAVSPQSVELPADYKTRPLSAWKF
ncbi:hypothetical protein [Methylogaea oryzae]|uniref:DUF4412 domain-containing protein n=1 Tax=Methylogaea oryzae TaxID=1295382 RepID=A0A8D5AHR4_9GAMM|nr:hypothetical protein [Methylogaea oryzae]BBL71728.1 hypothetical protein MoryE10_23340 [Methylogaea oryzae]